MTCDLSAWWEAVTPRVCRAQAPSLPLDMCSTCEYVRHMSKMIQLRHVPDSLHRQLKARATIEGMSLSEYLIREVRKIAERPTLNEIKARLAAMGPSRLKTSPTAIIREERDRR